MLTVQSRQLMKGGHVSCIAAGCVALLLMGCAAEAEPEREAPITLYRNSPLDVSMRIQFATFDAPDGTYHNLSNCRLAARVLNANVRAVMAENGSTAEQEAGFWCEVGAMNEVGITPDSFDAEFPSEVR